MKRALLISWLLAVTALGAPKDRARGKAMTIIPEPDLPCGTYLGQGEMAVNSNGDYLLALNKKSSSPTELLVLGGKIADKRSRIGLKVWVEFYVPKAIKSNEQPFVFLQKFVKLEQSADLARDFVREIGPEPCGQMAKFKQ